MDIWRLARRAIAAPLPGIGEADVRIPARHAACSVYLPEPVVLSPEAFPELLGVPAVREAVWQKQWLLVSFTDVFYDACVCETAASLPLPADDRGSHALNRMLALARQGGAGCPDIEGVRRALWLLLGAAYGYTNANAAARAWTRMLYALPVRARMEARRTCGPMADASARLYGRALGGETAMKD